MTEAKAKRSRLAKCFACFDKTIALAVAAAAVAQAFGTIVQLLAMVFNIVILRQGIAFVADIVPEIERLFAELFASFAIQLLPLVQAFEAVQHFLLAFQANLSIACVTASHLITMTVSVWVRIIIRLFYSICIVQIPRCCRGNISGVPVPGVHLSDGRVRGSQALCHSSARRCVQCDRLAAAHDSYALSQRLPPTGTLLTLSIYSSFFFLFV